MRLEKDLNLQIKNHLSLYEFFDQIIWHTRLNSGSIKTYFGSHIKLCTKGTWDWVVVIRNRQDGLSLLFIEGKSDTGKLSTHQKLFQKKYNKKDVYFLIVVDIKELDKFIDKHAKDYVIFLPTEL